MIQFLAALAIAVAYPVAAAPFIAGTTGDQALTITDVGVINVTQTTVDVTWTVSAPATGQVEYGTTAAYGETSALEASFDYQTHVQQLSTLTPGTLYHYRVKSQDQAGRWVVSDAYSFRTLGAIAPPTAATAEPTASPEAAPDTIPAPSSTPPTDASRSPSAENPVAQLGPPAGTLYPPERRLRYVPTPGLPRPGYLQPITDPTWGTKIVRIADQAAFGSTSTALRHAYSRVQGWNADGSLLMLGYSPSASALLDGTTYRFLRWVRQPADAVWSNRDPNIVFGVNGGSNQFVKMDVRTGVRTILRTFSNYSTIRIGDAEGYQSNDDRYVVLHARGSRNALIVYDIAANVIVAEKAVATMPDNSSISPSGTYVLVNFEGLGGGVQVWSRNLVYQRTLTSRGLHGDLGYDAFGNEVWVQAGATLPMWRLRDGVRTDLIPGGGTVWDYSHVSMRSTGRPGWVYMSHYEAPTARLGSDQVVAVRADGSGTVQVFAHAHHAYTGYVREPHAVPSRDGRRVLFASEWGASSGPVYTYVAGMAP